MPEPSSELLTDQQLREKFKIAVKELRGVEGHLLEGIQKASARELAIDLTTVLLEYTSPLYRNVRNQVDISELKSFVPLEGDLSAEYNDPKRQTLLDKTELDAFAEDYFSPLLLKVKQNIDERGTPSEEEGFLYMQSYLYDIGKKKKQSHEDNPQSEEYRLGERYQELSKEIAYDPVRDGPSKNLP